MLEELPSAAEMTAIPTTMTGKGVIEILVVRITIEVEIVVEIMETRCFPGLALVIKQILAMAVNQDLATAVVAAAAAAVTSVVQDKGCKQTGLEAEDLRVVFLLKEPFFQWEVVLR